MFNNISHIASDRFQLIVISAHVPYMQTKNIH